MDLPSVYLHGGGAAGAGLARALAAAGCPVLALYRRSAADAERAAAFAGVPAAWGEGTEAASRAAVVIIAVRDDAIALAAGSLAQAGRFAAGQAVLHLSGCLPAAVLRPAVPAGVAVGSLHPVATLPSAEAAAERLAGAPFALEGDAAAVAVAGRLVGALGGRPFLVAADRKPLYHAALAVAANHLVALAADAAALAEAAGLSPEAAAGLVDGIMSNTLSSLRQRGAAAALTGPAARGDAPTIRAHLSALGTAAPALLESYRALARRALELARRGGGADAAGLLAIEALLAEP